MYMYVILNEGFSRIHLNISTSRFGYILRMSDCMWVLKITEKYFRTTNTYINTWIQSSKYKCEHTYIMTIMSTRAQS